MNNDKIIEGDVLEALLNTSNDQTINGVEYTYIGSGCEGSVYMVNGKIIKVFKKIDIIRLAREYFILGLLNDINYPYVIKVYKFPLSIPKPYIVMEKMDGDLNKWYETEILYNSSIKSLSSSDYDDYWLSMLFQISHAIYLLGRMNITHRDLNPGNVLYSRNVDNKNKEYSIDNITYIVPNKFIFKLIDFSWVAIVGSKTNFLPYDAIINFIDTNYDVCTLLYSFLIYIEETLNNFKNIELSQNPLIKKYILKLSSDKNNKQDIMKRTMRYALREGLIRSYDILKNPKIRCPSYKVTKVMDNIMNVKNINKISLFDMYKK